MKTIDIFSIKYEDVKIKTSDAQLLRGYFGNKFKNYDEMHNHTEGSKVIYRYPLVQYKVIKGNPIVIGIEDGAKVLQEAQVFLEDELVIGNKIVVSESQKIVSEKCLFGVTDKILKYTFLTPWMSLNQLNINKYNKLDEIEKEEFLKRMLIGNILSISKGMQYHVSENIKVRLNVQEKIINYKGNKMLAFMGEFYTNFEIPNYMAIGKGISRGFGTIKKVL